MYVEISPELVTKISEQIMPEVTAWQNRPLEKVYPFIFNEVDAAVAQRVRSSLIDAYICQNAAGASSQHFLFGKDPS